MINESDLFIICSLYLFLQISSEFVLHGSFPTSGDPPHSKILSLPAPIYSKNPESFIVRCLFGWSQIESFKLINSFVS